MSTSQDHKLSWASIRLPETRSPSFGWNSQLRREPTADNVDILCLINHDTLKFITEEEQDDGQWTIRSVRAQKYLRFDNTPDGGTPLVGLDKL
jgi:hypothetical protein